VAHLLSKRSAAYLEAGAPEEARRDAEEARTSYAAVRVYMETLKRRQFEFVVIRYASMHGYTERHGILTCSRKRGTTLRRRGYDMQHAYVWVRCNGEDVNI
jgi:hypothetical protein